MQQMSEITPTPRKQVKLAARTSAGLHDTALASLGKFLTIPAKVLDLGAGTGAWAERLVALQHEVMCVERDIDNFALHSVRCIQADLNEDFLSSVTDEYAAITALEVIEHLENPRHFLRQCYELLDDEGILLITTPNIECLAGRLRFLSSGHFRMFDRNEEANDPTHITPIQTFMFEKMIKDTGYKLILHESSTALSAISNPSARFISRLLTPFVSGFKGGDNHIFILAKK
jgi:2-polyprenyl-3-methyl-5-hydroxy-6-metoxy-1,4-benzoquinol methylase